MTLVMQLRHGLVTAVGGKGEIEVAQLQRGCSLCLPTEGKGTINPYPKKPQTFNNSDLVHQYYMAGDIIVKCE